MKFTSRELRNGQFFDTKPSSRCRLHGHYDTLTGNFKHISTILVYKFIMKTKAECKQNSVKSFGHGISYFGLVLT